MSSALRGRGLDPSVAAGVNLPATGLGACGSLKGPAGGWLPTGWLLGGTSGGGALGKGGSGLEGLVDLLGGRVGVVTDPEARELLGHPVPATIGEGGHGSGWLGGGGRGLVPALL